jgi:hypothetical protein
MDYADLREAIHGHLVTNVPAVGGRVWWGWTAPSDAQKPFLLMTFTGELPSVNTPLGLFLQYDVLAVGVEADILSLDPVADAVVTALHEVDIVTGAGRVIRSEYKRDARMDMWSQDLMANIIRLKFWLPTDFWT